MATEQLTGSQFSSRLRRERAYFFAPMAHVSAVYFSSRRSRDARPEGGCTQLYFVSAVSLYRLYRCIYAVSAVSAIDTARQGECAVSSVTPPVTLQSAIQRRDTAARSRHGTALLAWSSMATVADFLLALGAQLVPSVRPWPRPERARAAQPLPVCRVRRLGIKKQAGRGRARQLSRVSARVSLA